MDSVAYVRTRGPIMSMLRIIAVIQRFSGDVRLERLDDLNRAAKL